MASSGPNEVVAVNVATSIEVPKAIERWLATGRSLDELGLLVQEEQGRCRVVPLFRAELVDVAAELFANTPGQSRAAPDLVANAIKSAASSEVPCLFLIAGVVSIGITTLEIARENAARSALIRAAGRNDSKDA